MVRCLYLVMKFCAVLIALFAFFLIPSLSYPGDLFRWVDERGVVHFTDNIHNIPEKYRTNATRIKTAETPRDPGPSKPTYPDKVSVPFQKKGAVVVVQAILNEKASANFIVDTGASFTMISRATAKELEIDLEGKLPVVLFQTANGVILAPLVNLEMVEVGGMQVRDLTVAVHDAFPGSNVAGLLGLDFLSHFRLDIDTRNGLLHLEKK